MKKFKIATLGCKVNQYESESMEKLFLERGYEKANKNESADVYVINTCAVTGQASSKSRQYISRAKRNNPQAQIAVVGCYSQVTPEEIDALGGINVILGTKERSRIVDLLEESERIDQTINAVGDIKHDQKFDELDFTTKREMTRAYIKIQEGCNMFCSYCIIPYARGPISTRDMNHIIEETKNLAASGYKEVVLTGIHVESYGKDRGKDYYRLIDVIEKVAEIEGIERIRLSSLEPRAIDHEFLDRYKKTGKGCDHFHLSLQSGSEDVLKAMNRKYTPSVYKDKVDLIRSYFPDCGITTDIIVGFPGETDALFDETMDFVKTIEFSKIHVFPFSRRKGTPAYDFKNQIEGNVKKARSKALSTLEAEISHAFLDSFIGKDLDVLFELDSSSDQWTMGYSTNYLRVEVPRDFDLVNQIKKVRIIERDGDILRGAVEN